MDTQAPVLIGADALESLVRDIFTGAGCDAEEAARIAAHLLGANLAGHDSHGVARVPRYVEWLESGYVLKGQTVETITDGGAFLLLDNVGNPPATPVAGLEDARAAGLVTFDLLDVWQGRDQAALRIAPWDNHPNPQGTPAGGAGHQCRSSTRRFSSTMAATSDPRPMSNETVGSAYDVNRKPAMIGASTDPPRPTPTATPVPDARTCVGNAFAKIAYIPVIAAFVQKPATMQMRMSFVRSAGDRPNTVTAIVDSSITVMVRALTLKRCDSSPRTVPPVAPPTFSQLNT